MHPELLESLACRGLPVGAKIRGLDLLRNAKFTLGEGEYLVEVTNGYLSARFTFALRGSFDRNGT